MGNESTALRADRSIAVLAGRNSWYDADRHLTIAVRSTGGAELLALVAAATVVLAYVIGHDRNIDSAVERYGPALFATTCVLAAIGPGTTLLGRRARPRPLWVNVVTLFASTDGWYTLLAWPLGVAMGCDLALTAQSLGWRASVAQWWWTFITSPMHFGVLGGLLGASLTTDGASITATALPIYAIIQIWVGIAALTAWSTLRILDIEAAALDDVRADTAHDEHRRSAHWLHDDICARLRMTTLQVQRGVDSPHQVVGMLDELDFALRLRQLDELIGSGSVRLAEVLQPFVRRAQQHGVVVERVPSYELASTVVGPDVARQLRHAAAVVTANALNAGAGSIAFDIAVHGDTIELAVSDDAGGFDPTAIQAGRALWSLREDLGAHGLTIDRIDRGSRVTARVPRHARRTHGTLAAR
jgi:hypothetical protein